MYQRIIVPLDGSEVAARALPHAAELARLTGSPIHLVRVTDATRLARYGYHGSAADYPVYEQLLTEEITASKAYLATVEHDLVGLGLTVTQEIRHGAVQHELQAVSRPGDIIVMTSHGRGGVTRWFLGSVAEEVARHATVPVLLVRMPVAADGDQPDPEPVATASGTPTMAGVTTGNGLP